MTIQEFSRTLLIGNKVSLGYTKSRQYHYVDGVIVDVIDSVDGGATYYVDYNVGGETKQTHFIFDTESGQFSPKETIIESEKGNRIRIKELHFNNSDFLL